MAMHLLKRQTGITNFKPLKDNCIKIVQATQGAVAFTPGSAFLHTLPLLRTEGKSGLPSLVVKLTDAEDELKKGLKLVTQGKFSTALGCFNNIFQLLPLLVVNSSLQTDVLTLLSYAREYVTAIRLELARRESKEPVRQAELAAYFANCEIQPLHQLLGLRSAIKYAYGVKCNKTTAGFCRRVLELSTNYAAFKTKQIKGVLKLCEKNETDAKELNYDASKAFDVCCKTFEPLYHGEAPSVKCPYCASVYKKEFAGEVCATCQMGKIGAQSTGLKCWKD
jgi:coatomer protein complex subunit alpha (xenin)